jgi:deazaflavin-dependent oxidoreductase (nitroreductase family)
MKVLESPKPRAATILNRAAHALLRKGSERLNPFMLSIAGSRRLPMLAVIHHRGRRSGRPYRTPLAARPTADGFVIPLTFGEQADWVRNVLTAGGCMIRWNGMNYQVIEPEVVDWATVRTSFYPAERVLIPLIGIERFVRLRYAPVSASDPT